MVPNKKCIELINYRINQEEFSSRLYYAMSVWLDNNAYKSAKLWKKYSEEELVHRDKANEFLLSFGIMPEVRTIQSVEASFKGLDDIITLSYAHEKLISQQCEALQQCGFDEKNWMVFNLGQWFVNEQVEEMNKVQNLLDQLKTFGTDKIALRLLDEELGG